MTPHPLPIRDAVRLGVTVDCARSGVMRPTWCAMVCGEWKVLGGYVEGLPVKRRRVTCPDCLRALGLPVQPRRASGFCSAHRTDGHEDCLVCYPSRPSIDRRARRLRRYRQAHRSRAR